MEQDADCITGGAFFWIDELIVTFLIRIWPREDLADDKGMFIFI